MKRYDDQRANRRDDGVQSLATKANPEHKADEVEQKRPAHADDDRLDDAIMRSGRLCVWALTYTTTTDWTVSIKTVAYN